MKYIKKTEIIRMNWFMYSIHINISFGIEFIIYVSLTIGPIHQIVVKWMMEWGNTIQHCFQIIQFWLGNWVTSWVDKMQIFVERTKSSSCVSLSAVTHQHSSKGNSRKLCTLYLFVEYLKRSLLF